MKENTLLFLLVGRRVAIDIGKVSRGTGAGGDGRGIYNGSAQAAFYNQ